MLALAALLNLTLASAAPAPIDTFRVDAQTAQSARNAVVRLARRCASAHGVSSSGGPAIGDAGGWEVRVAVYSEGVLTHEGFAGDAELDRAICDAAAKAVGGTDAAPASLPGQARLLVSLRRGDGEPVSMIEFHGLGLELASDLIPLRTLMRADVGRAVEANKAYLKRVMHPELHGFSKKYDVERGGFDDRLRTIYTSSALYSLLRVNALAPDPWVEQRAPLIADFILSMQKQDAPYQGAFHYAYDLNSGQLERRFPVGTTAKIIMTLIALHDKQPDPRYLAAASAAGDWLLSMQTPDGGFPVDVAWRDGGWDTNQAFSLFYNCQVLTGLSRLYGAGGAERHLEGARRLAQKLLGMVEEGGYLLRDEYRPKVESISTSWLAMALLDYSRIDPNGNSREVAFRCLDALLTLQLTDPDDILTYGRFADTRATSGNGWINEVISELLGTCRADGRAGCERLERALVLTSRWLIQNTYSLQNTYHIKDAERVIGGMIRNEREEAVRTDAVCHGVNSMVGLLQLIQGEQLLP